MKFVYIIAGIIFAIVGYGCSELTLPRVAWQTTRVLFWNVNIPVPSMYQPLAFFSLPLYFLAAICVLYGLFSSGEAK